MKRKKDDSIKDMSLKSLGAALRRFPDVAVPKTLEARLLAQTPRSKAMAPTDSQRRPHWGFWSFGGAAAAALVLAIILASSYMPNSNGHDYSLSPACPNYARADQNTTVVQDINTSFVEQR
jgi:hypothetical protein